MGYFNSIDISASALSAQRLRMDVISQNMANIDTTRTESGGPYRRKIVLFNEKNESRPFSSYLSDESKSHFLGKGVGVTRVVEDSTPFKKILDPSHPDADEDGYVSMPNVDSVTEMLNMISASRAYEANVTAVNTAKSIAMKALDIGR